MKEGVMPFVRIEDLPGGGQRTPSLPKPRWYFQKNLIAHQTHKRFPSVQFRSRLALGFLGAISGDLGRSNRQIHGLIANVAQNALAPSEKVITSWLDRVNTVLIFFTRKVINPSGRFRGRLEKVAAMAVLAQRWVVLYQLALVEMDPAKMATRLLDARHEIFNRAEELKDLAGPHETESQAIQDALNQMRSLHKEQQEWAANRREELDGLLLRLH
jgi:hypothetical protein